MFSLLLNVFDRPWPGGQGPAVWEVAMVFSAKTVSGETGESRWIVEESVSAPMLDLEDATDPATATAWRVVDEPPPSYRTGAIVAEGIILVDGLAVTFDEEGRWTSSRLDVPYISQLPDMPSGCEIVSVTMMLNFAGVDVSKEELAAGLPYASDPNEGFTGSLYASGDSGYSGIIWPSALLALVGGYQESVVDLTGESWDVLRGFINEGKPVCVWLLGNGLHHTVLLTGYSDSMVWLNDPLASKDSPLDIDIFLQQWEQNGYRALSY